MSTPQTFLPHGGSYKNLIAYQKAECIYDVTFYFAHHFLEKTTEPSTKWYRQHAPASRI